MWKAKAHKIDLSQQEAKKLISEIEKISKQELDGVLNDAYVPIRQIENLIRKLEPISTVMDSVQRLSKVVQQAESLRDETQRKLRQAANDLDVDIPEPKWISELSDIISYGQRAEQTARKDANVYSSVYRKLSSVLKEI